jgi:uncharacterized protein (DUF169 family)
LTINQREIFINYWNDFFPNTPLPIVFYYTDDESVKLSYEAPKSNHCIVADISSVRNGRSIYLESNNLICNGAKRYFGFTNKIRDDFNYFLSCGIDGEVQGERYKKYPELVEKTMSSIPQFEAPGKYLVFKQWDKVDESDNITGVIFIVHPDVLSGLFTLTNFDEDNPFGVMSPFSSGCGSLVCYTYHESLKEFPKATLGMFDVSARPFVANDELSFSVPNKKMEKIIENIEQSFLITDSWSKIQHRIKKYY